MPACHRESASSTRAAAKRRPGLCLLLLLSLVLALPAGACSEQQPALPASSDAPGRLTVFVSILPLAYFAERLGGEQLAVEVLVGPGQSPSTYEPTPRQLTQLARASLLFRIGAPFERALLPRLQQIAPKLGIVDTRQGIELLYGTSACGDPHEHEHGHEQEHEQEAPAAPANSAAQGAADPHIWLDPRRALQVARTMAAALARQDPPHAALYRARLGQLEQELNALDRELTQLLAPLAGQRLFVYHGAYGYFCQRYKLEQVALEQGGKESGARQLAGFIAQARQAGARALFIQPQYSRREAAAVARSIGAKLVTLDPLSRRYLQDLRALAQTVRDQLAPAPAAEGASKRAAP